jgi:hypothetical protein
MRVGDHECVHDKQRKVTKGVLHSFLGQGGTEPTQNMTCFRITTHCGKWAWLQHSNETLLDEFQNRSESSQEVVSVHRTTAPPCSSSSVAHLYKTLLRRVRSA